MAARPPAPADRPRYRIGVKELMVAVAAVALTFGAAIELQNRQGRDRHAAAEAEARRALDWHREQVDTCDRALASDAPYPIKQRNQDWRRSARQAGLAPDDISFRGWANEREWHRYRIGQLDPVVEDNARRKGEYQRRLLLP